MKNKLQQVFKSKSKYFRQLAESKNYVLGHEFEYCYLIYKLTKHSIYLGSCYGDPSFGLIDKNEKWALLLAHPAYLWTPSQIFNLNEGQSPAASQPNYPFVARQIGDFEAEILDDPWSDSPGIHNLNTKTGVIQRVRDFKRLETLYDNNIEIDW
jgi:hypothetical protein